MFDLDVARPETEVTLMRRVAMLRGKQDENSTSIRMRKCRRMRDEGRA
jgi:hypothetical protein